MKLLKMYILLCVPTFLFAFTVKGADSLVENEKGDSLMSEYFVWEISKEWKNGALFTAKNERDYSDAMEKKVRMSLENVAVDTFSVDLDVEFLFSNNHVVEAFYKERGNVEVLIRETLKRETQAINMVKTSAILKKQIGKILYSGKLLSLDLSIDFQGLEMAPSEEVDSKK